MSNNRSIPPALISVSRIRTLVASIFVSLGSGTNYVRKFYGMEQLVDCLSLCSLFAITGNTAEDVLYAVEHCRASWKWCGISGNLAPLPDTFQSGFAAGNFFSLLFGRNLDAHKSSRQRPTEPSSRCICGSSMFARPKLLSEHHLYLHTRYVFGYPFEYLPVGWM